MTTPTKPTPAAKKFAAKLVDAYPEGLKVYGWTLEGLTDQAAGNYGRFGNEYPARGRVEFLHGDDGQLVEGLRCTFATLQNAIAAGLVVVSDHPTGYAAVALPTEELDIVVGSSVRSFDFEGRDLDGERACYIEGTVLAIGRPLSRHAAYAGIDVYTIAVTRRVFGGTEDLDIDGAHIFAPVNGLDKLFGGVTDGVVVIEAA